MNHDTRSVGRRPKYMHWFGSLRHFIRLSLIESKDIILGRANDNCQNSTTKNDPTQSATYFNHLLSIALKYLYIHCEINPRELTRCRRNYKLAIVCLFAFLSLFVFANVVFSWTNSIATCSSKPQYCTLEILSIILSGGYVLNGALTFIFFGAMVIGVVGLSYGSTLAYFMASSWMKRFAGLRRITDDQTVSSAAMDADVRVFFAFVFY